MLDNTKTLCLQQSKMTLSSFPKVNNHRFLLVDKSMVTSEPLSLVVKLNGFDLPFQ